ncbi:hypothetical protein [Pseudomonas sp. H26/SER47-MNA-CIBAN-0231]|uniref:HNH endonuclease n=1 Tax=Pseudomonas chlororaphis TaxID=587753 RepID=A0A0A6DGY7_9PSED|nr:hypothetical protein NZ35_06795 [Pseudomonas chlororaphis]
MLFTYPIAATANNWISTTLLSVLQTALEAFQQGNEPLVFHETIPDIYQEEFSRGRKFVELYNAFLDECRNLEAQQHDLILAALSGQNHFPGLYSINTTCPSIAETLPAVHKATRALFEYAFGKLSDLRTPGSTLTIRADYHKIVYSHLENGCCPFCGLELLEAPDPDLVDPDLDHYLAVSKYPFAGANLLNLTAMGTICNRSYKGANDILLDELDRKAECMDPYADEHVTISLNGTVLLPGDGRGPTWRLTFNPDAKSRNWQRVFKIEQRYRINILEKQYKTWLEQYIHYAYENDFDISDRDSAINAIRKFKKTCAFETLPAIARLKTDFFELVETELNHPLESDRMHNFIAALKKI